MSFSTSATPLRYKAWLCVPALIYVLIAVWWHVRATDYLTGDEAHFLFVAESIVEDGDVDVANNLRSHGFESPGWRESHSIESPHGWFSLHNLGLPALVALPWELWGAFGARLMMVACCGSAAPILYQAINRAWRSPRNSLLVTMALALGMPLLDASTQIYPDLLAGVLLLFAADCAMAGAEGTPVAGWRLLVLSAVLAFLPWLHMKYAAPALIVVIWCLDATRRPRTLAAAAALVASLGALACYNWYAFGKPTGPYAGGSALVVHPNNFIVLMGLHYDQAQGMFLQQPLLVLGLVGLAPMWRGAKRACFWWLLLYAAAIVPNAMHPTWYGGYSFLGRFGSTSVLLWAIPLAFGARAVFGEEKRLPAIVVACSLALQAGLAGFWLPAHERLFQEPSQEPWRECVWSYQSVYPSIIKTYLPYWFPFASFRRYPANFSALVLTTGLLASGWFWQRRRAWAKGCCAGATLAAVVLPLLVPTKSPPAVWAAADMHGQVGREDGQVRVAAEGRDGRGILAMSPDFYPAPGNYRVAVDYRADGPADDIGLVMFKCGETLKLLSPLSPGGEQARQDFSTVQISPGECGQRSSFLVWYEGRGTLSVASLSVQKTYK